MENLLLKYVQIIEETRRRMERVPKEVMPRVGWDKVVDMAKILTVQATSVGIVWRGDVSDASLTDKMIDFFGLLQRVIILGHGATRDAGITLAACMRNAVDNLYDASMNLMKEAVSSHDCENKRNGDTIPKLRRLLWDAWIALGKIPVNNVTAIGEALAQVAISVKEKLGKMEELKKASAGAKDAVSGDAGSSTDQQKEGSGEDIKDGVSGDEGKGSKEPKEAASVPSDNIGLPSEEKTIAPVSDLLVLMIGLINKEREAAAADFVEFAENMVEKMLEEVEKESQEKLSGEAENDPLICKLKVSDLSPEDQISIAQLTTDAVSGIAELLNQLGPAVITLLDKEREGTVKNFVDCVESVLKISKDIESEIEVLFDPEDIISRISAFKKVSIALRELAVMMHLKLKGDSYPREFRNAWTKCDQLMKQVAAEFRKHNPVERQQP